MLPVFFFRLRLIIFHPSLHQQFTYTSADLIYSLNWVKIYLKTFWFPQCKSLFSPWEIHVRFPETCLTNLKFGYWIILPLSKHIVLITHLSDDPRAVHSCRPAKPTPPTRSIRVQCPSLPNSRHLRLEEEMPVLLHPPSTCHNDCQPGTHHLDSQSHELHSGKRLLYLRR